jgi:CheY-like chemotaxis protein
LAESWVIRPVSASSRATPKAAWNFKVASVAALPAANNSSGGTLIALAWTIRWSITSTNAFWPLLLASSKGCNRCLKAGMDSYLSKPVELRELEAQIRTLSRRLKLFPPCAPADPPKPPGGAWGYDPIGWMVISPDGVAVKLTANERVFMSLLVERPGEPVSRDEIFRALGKRQWDPSDRSVDSMVRRLRAKAADQLGTDLPIEAVHGTGYAFAATISVL